LLFQINQLHKYLLQAQALTHPLLALNLLGLRLLVAAVAVVALTVLVRLVVVAVEQLPYGFTLVALHPQQAMPMLLELVVLVA
tara:strand:- start:61 stop:309 length:249 start_codon:yes stop_codon:yes gene_type:complete